MKFVFPIHVPASDWERHFGIWCRWYDREVPPHHERIRRIAFMYRDEHLEAVVGEPVRPGDPPVVAIIPDPAEYVVCRLTDGAFTVPAHNVYDIETFDALEEALTTPVLSTRGAA